MYTLTRGRELGHDKIEEKRAGQIILERKKDARGGGIDLYPRYARLTEWCDLSERRVA